MPGQALYLVSVLGESVEDILQLAYSSFQVVVVKNRWVVNKNDTFPCFGLELACTFVSVQGETIWHKRTHLQVFPVLRDTSSRLVVRQSLRVLAESKAVSHLTANGLQSVWWFSCCAAGFNQLRYHDSKGIKTGTWARSRCQWRLCDDQRSTSTKGGRCQMVSNWCLETINRS